MTIKKQTNQCPCGWQGIEPEDKLCPECGKKLPINLVVQNVSVTTEQLFGGKTNG